MIGAVITYVEKAINTFERWRNEQNGQIFAVRAGKREVPGEYPCMRSDIPESRYTLD
jgi:hypothetical protein